MTLRMIVIIFLTLQGFAFQATAIESYDIEELTRPLQQTPPEVARPQSANLNEAKLKQCVADYLEERKKRKARQRAQRQKEKAENPIPGFVKVAASEVRRNPFRRTDLAGFKKALDDRIRRCRDPRRNHQKIRLDKKVVDRTVYCHETSVKLWELAQSVSSMEELWQKIPANFDFYRHEITRKCSKSPSDREAQFTAYDHPTVKASRVKTPRFSHPFYGPPRTLPRPYLTRQQIERGQLPPEAKLHGYLESPLDLYIAQIEGSMEVQFVDPKNSRVEPQVHHFGYAGNNGHLLVFFGPVMKCMGVEKRYTQSIQGYREYFKDHPEHLSSYMAQTPSYVFFKETPKGAMGAFGVPLVGGHSLAVNPNRLPYGGIALMNAAHPVLGSANVARGETPRYQTFSTLALLDDTGSAIVGDECKVRGDYFAGSDEEASFISGTMGSPGQLFLLISK